MRSFAMEIMRESIFTSALRSFCRMFFAVCGIFLAFFLISFIYSSLAPSILIEEKTTMTLLPDASGTRKLVPFSAPAVLQINIHGIIGMDAPESITAEAVENILLDSRSHLLANDRVKAILLHLNTPGGTVVDSDSIYRLLKDYKAKYKTPIFAYVDGLCASGGMYIASSADQIFASPPSLIGSVGVIYGPMFNVAETLHKLGVEALTITQGIGKDALNPTRPWKPGEDTSYQAITAFLYQQFVDIVTAGRPRINREKLIEEYGAHVFNCVEAEKFGYIDHALSSRNAALLALLEAARIDPSQPYQVVEIAPTRNWLSQMIKGESALFSGKLEHTVDLGQSKIQGQFAYLYTP
jgi:protease-4